MYKYLTCFITVSSKKEGKKIIKDLLEKKFIACGNIIKDIESIYWWKGKIENSKELLLILKTEVKFVEKIIKEVKNIHSYDVPEIIFLPIISGNKDYLNWIKDCLK